MTLLETLRVLRAEPVPPTVSVSRSVREFVWWRLDFWIQALDLGSWDRAIYEIAAEAAT